MFVFDLLGLTGLVKLASPVVAIGALYLAIRAAWNHRGKTMAVLIGVAALALAVTFGTLLTT